MAQARAKFCTHCGEALTAGAKFCSACGAGLSGATSPSTASAPITAPALAGIGVAQSPLDVVFVIAAAAQVLAFMLVVVWQEPWSYLGEYFTDYLVPTLFGDLFSRALVILLGVAVVIRREMDLRLLAGAIVSAVVVGVQSIAEVARVVEDSVYSGYRWSLLLSGIVGATSLLTAAVGLLRLQQSNALTSAPEEAWRVLPLLIGFVLLMIEWPGRVLPDRFPALSLAVLVIAVVLVVGQPSLRLGAIVGFALPVVTSIVFYLSARILRGLDFFSWVSIPSVIALGMCGLALIPVNLPGGKTAESGAA